MKKEVKKQSSSLPLIIIGAVLAIAVVGAYFYYNSAKTTTANKNANVNAVKTSNSAASAPLGAVPPNMMGSPTAPVTLEEFADFQCPSCASVHPIIKEITSTYGGRIRFVYRNFPLAIPQHDKAYEAAVAAEAAGMQDRAKFWAMRNMLFENQQSWTNNSNYRSMWEGYAQEIGLDVEKFKADMAGREAKSRVDADMARGRGLSIDSTPTLFVNGKNIPLQQITTANLRQVIDAEIQNAVKTQPASNTATPASNPASSNSNTTK